MSRVTPPGRRRPESSAGASQAGSRPLSAIARSSAGASSPTATAGPNSPSTGPSAATWDRCASSGCVVPESQSKDCPVARATSHPWITTSVSATEPATSPGRSTPPDAGHALPRLRLQPRPGQLGQSRRVAGAPVVVQARPPSVGGLSVQLAEVLAGRSGERQRQPADVCHQVVKRAVSRRASVRSAGRRSRWPARRPCAGRQRSGRSCLY